MPPPRRDTPAAARIRRAPLAATAVLAALLLVAVTLDVWADGALRRFDASLFTDGLPSRAGPRHLLWRTVVNGGQFWIVGSLTALAAVHAAHRDRSAGVAVRAAAWLVVTAAAIRAAQALFGRTPPRTGHDLLFEPGFLSYPSGHAAGSAACLLLVAALLRPAPRWFALAGAVSVLVSVATVALGYHWATDAVGGWSLGVLLACAGAATVPARPVRAPAPAPVRTGAPRGPETANGR